MRNHLRSLYRIAAASVVMATTSALACEVPSTRPLDVLAEDRARFDTGAFTASIVDDLDRAVMGYAAVLRSKSGRIIASVEYGYARNPCESAGEQNFSINTQAAWGSVTKMITTAAVIDKTERSTARRLTEPMIDFLPEDWRSGVDGGYDDVTISHLLSYRSGLANNPPPGVNRRDLAARLAQPPARPVGRRTYNNIEFALLLYMGRFFREGYWDSIEQSYQPGEIDYDSYVYAHGLSIYTDVVQGRILTPLNINASCNDSRHSGQNYALFYSNRDQEKGFLLTPSDASGCSTGGVIMNAKHMSKFLHALSQTENLISAENYDTLLAPDSERLHGWNGAREVEDGLAVHKAGGRRLGGNSIPGNSATGRAGANIMAFPNGMTAVVVINSGRTSGTKSLRDVLIDAYNAGLPN
ncbi:MAG: serine hydrolase [Pseudomonadota bacterium]